MEPTDILVEAEGVHKTTRSASRSCACCAAPRSAWRAGRTAPSGRQRRRQEHAVAHPRRTGPAGRGDRALRRRIFYAVWVCSVPACRARHYWFCFSIYICCPKLGRGGERHAARAHARTGHDAFPALRARLESWKKWVSRHGRTTRRWTFGRRAAARLALARR